MNNKLINKKIIILAAGNSTRMQATVPKFLHKVANLELINHVILAASNNQQDIIIVLNNQASLLVKQAVINQDVKYVIQEQQLGTADAVTCALDTLNDDDDVIILYADVPFITKETIELLFEQLTKLDLIVVAFIDPTFNNYGKLIVDQQQNLIKIIEHPEATKEQQQINLCNSGIIATKAKLLRELLPKINNDNHQQEYYLTDLIQLAVNHNYQVKHLLVDQQEVIGINNRSELAKAESIIQNKLRAKFLNNGVSIIHPATIVFSYDTDIADDVTIHPFNVFGLGVKIGQSVVIESFCHLTQVIIKENSIIGPYARLRGKTTIGPDCRIGNFVELKNSKIASETKINHLSYLGDAIVGSKVNIGAGVITCNYDGYKKHSTIIKDQVFVGSNANLIAPITIGHGAIIAAGSTINRSVTENALAIERADLNIIEDLATNIRAKKAKL